MTTALIPVEDLVRRAPDARPRTWGECQAAELGTAANPCPWVSCRWHLALGVDDDGDLHLHPTADADGLPPLESMPYTCALAAADANPDGATLEQVGDALGLTRERIRQIEAKVLYRKRTSLRGDAGLRDLLDDGDSTVPLGAVQSREYGGPVRAADGPRAWADAPAALAHLPAPEAVPADPAARFWCGCLRADLTVSLCCARQTARQSLSGGRDVPLYRDCADCDRGAALRERVGVLPVAPVLRLAALPPPTTPATPTTQETTVTTVTTAPTTPPHNEVSPAVRPLCTRCGERPQGHVTPRTRPEHTALCAACRQRDHAAAFAARKRERVEARAAKAPRAVKRPAPVRAAAKVARTAPVAAPVAAPTVPTPGDLTSMLAPYIEAHELVGVVGWDVVRGLAARIRGAALPRDAAAAAGAVR